MRYILIFVINLILTGYAVSQNTITFEIKEKSGESLIGASIVIEGTAQGTISSAEGVAKLENIPNGKVVFVISFVGYEELEIALDFPENNSKAIKIELEEGEELQEVIISTTRSSRTIQDIPTRIEAITGEELGEKAAMNSSNIGMLLSETTGTNSANFLKLWKYEHSHSRLRWTIYSNSKRWLSALWRFCRRTFHYANTPIRLKTSGTYQRK